jgi:hypothetical protein
VVIHHCGCAAYHYPILHEKPWITLGTMRYDREDVALRLEALGLSTHLPAPEEDADFGARFQAAFDAIQHADGAARRERGQKVAGIKNEIARTQRGFDFDQVLRAAVDNFRP